MNDETPDREAALEISRALRGVGTELISDALRRLGSTNYVLTGLGPVPDGRLTNGDRVAGPAFTIQRAPANRAHVSHASLREEFHQAVGSAKAGEVVVLGAFGTDEAVWGDGVTLLCKQRDIAGAVVDGAIRDSGMVRDVGLTVFARGRNFYSSGQVVLGVGAPVCIGGAIVRPGDVIVGDDDGVLVVAVELFPVILGEVEKHPIRRQ